MWSKLCIWTILLVVVREVRFSYSEEPEESCKQESGKGSMDRKGSATDAAPATRRRGAGVGRWQEAKREFETPTKEKISWLLKQRSFLNFLVSEFSVENGSFLRDLREVRNGVLDAEAFYETFIPDGAALMINISSETRTAVVTAKEAWAKGLDGSLSIDEIADLKANFMDALDGAAHEITTMIRGDTYMRFARTEAGFKLNSDWEANLKSKWQQ